MANQCCTDFTIIGPQAVVRQTLGLMVANLQASGIPTDQPPGDGASIDEVAAWVNEYVKQPGNHYLEALSGNVTSVAYGELGTEVLVSRYGSLNTLRMDFDTRWRPAKDELESFIESLPSPCGVCAISEESNMGIRDRTVVLKEDGVAKRVSLSSKFGYYENTSLDKANREIDRFYAQMHKMMTGRPAPLPSQYCENAACANDVEELERAWAKRAPTSPIDLRRVFGEKAYDAFIWLLENKLSRVSLQGFDAAKALSICCLDGAMGVVDAILSKIPMDDDEVRRAVRAVGKLEDSDIRTNVLSRLESICSERGIPFPNVRAAAPAPSPGTSSGTVGEKRRIGGIEWMIVAADGSRRLLVGEKLRDSSGEIVRMSYHGKREGVTWEGSDLRSWLNGEFLERFTEDELSMIVPVRVINYDNEKVGTPGGNDTVDRVFCLSSVGLRALVEKGDRKAFDGTWLRTPGNVPNMATCVIDGMYGAMVWQDGFDADTQLAVMPAMWVEEPRSKVGDGCFFSAAGFGELPSPAKKRLAISYLASKSSSTCGDMEQVNAYLRRNFKGMAKDILRSSDMAAAIDGAFQLGLITGGNLGEMIAAAEETGSPEAVGCLSTLSDKVGPGEKRAKKANPWSASELGKLWKFRDAGDGLELTQYKVSSAIALVPRSIGKKTVIAGGEWHYSFYSFSVPRDQLAHVIMPETIVGIDWRTWGHPAVHALPGSPAYLTAMMAGLDVVGLQYDADENGSYEAAATARAEELEGAGGRSFEKGTFDAGLTEGSKAGDVVTLGRFPGTEVPVPWRVVAANPDGALLLSEFVLAKMAFGRKGCTWEKSAARKWLNDELLNGYFNEREMERIVPFGSDAFGSKLVTADLVDGDRAFCLSLGEVRKHLKDGVEKRSFTVPYLDGSVEPSSWWLRSPGRPDFQFAQVNKDGSISTKGMPPKDPSGIRPAMFVRFKKPNQ